MKLVLKKMTVADLKQYGGYPITYTRTPTDREEKVTERNCSEVKRERDN